MSIDLSDYSYDFPSRLIANQPLIPRDHCRLLVLNRQTSSISHHHFYNLLDLLTPNDVLVINQTKVFPARLYGKKTTGGQVEVLLLRSLSNFVWEYISRPGLKTGTVITFDLQLTATVISTSEIQFELPYLEVLDTLNQIGQTPIPPYIHSPLSETDLRRSYQTVYAKPVGSAAAPTAGLHFTTKLLDQLRQKNVQIENITLHVGLGTFQSLRPEQIASDTLHAEFYEINAKTANNLNEAKKQGKRIIAVGTTTVRCLESSVVDSAIISQNASTNLFIHPPYQFKFVDGLITNFHLPESSLLMLVSAFASRDLILNAYQQAITQNYRLFSFGDAMLIV